MKMLVTKLSKGKYANESQLFAEIISDENVKLMGEMIALQALRNVMPYDYEVVSKLYNGLVKDLGTWKLTEVIFMSPPEASPVALRVPSKYTLMRPRSNVTAI